VHDADVARFTAACRIAIGAGLLAAPRLAARLWVGGHSRETSARLFARAVGARDVAIGAGTLLALAEGAPARRWLQAGLLADATDLGATLAAGRELPPAARALVASIAGTATLLGLRLVTALE
jgi:hypothetical protein